MVKILTYNQIDQAQWQALVNQSPTATWFQTPEAYKFYASVNEMMPFAVGVVESQECDSEAMGNGQWAIGKETSGAVTSAHTPKLKGVIVGYITKEKNPIKQLLTGRAIIIGGPLLAEDISATALAALLKAVKAMDNGQWAIGEENNRQSPIANRPIYIESRNFHDYSKWKSIFETNGYAYQPHLNFHVDCMQENMLATMSESRRRQIKKAIKSGVEIIEAQSQDDVIAYYEILKDLYINKVKTPLFPVEFFLSFFDNSFGKYLLVKYEGKIIGGIMCPILKARTIYEWFVCGLDEQYKNQYPSVMATYAAIEYANSNNISCFDFMGAGKPDEAYGVRDFKARFGGEMVEYGRYLCVRKPLLYNIGKLGVKLLKKR